LNYQTTELFSTAKVTSASDGPKNARQVDDGQESPFGGAERIRGELLKLSIRDSKRTIQKYMRPSRQHDGGQTWSTFVRTLDHLI